MPIYMDRHDVSEEVTAEAVAQLHQADLKIQHKFGCRSLTYWFDERRKTAFCLVEAPNKKAIQEMHDFAHGQLPHRIIEVNDVIVESFLGRIEDPETAQNTALNIINDPAFRTLVVTDIRHRSGRCILPGSAQDVLKKFRKEAADIIERYQGRQVKTYTNGLLLSFESVSMALPCAMALRSSFRKMAGHSGLVIHSGISAGIPVTDSDRMFEDTIEAAERMCRYLGSEIVVSTEVRDLYRSENLNAFASPEEVRVLSVQEESFLHSLTDFMDKKWNDPGLGVSDFSRELGLSKSQLYRKMTALTGKSPNAFLKEYRLNRSIGLLEKQQGNVSEIAYTCGFSSPAYFSACFAEAYGIRPSEFLKSMQGSPRAHA